MTTFTVSERTVAELKGDALVLVSIQTEKGAALATGHGLGKETVAHLESALKTLKAKGEADEVLKLVCVPGVPMALVALTGAGKASAAPLGAAFPAPVRTTSAMGTPGTQTSLRTSSASPLALRVFSADSR